MRCSRGVRSSNSTFSLFLVWDLFFPPKKRGPFVIHPFLSRILSHIWLIFIFVSIYIEMPPTHTSAQRHQEATVAALGGEGGRGRWQRRQGQGPTPVCLNYFVIGRFDGWLAPWSVGLAQATHCSVRQQPMTTREHQRARAHGSEPW